MSSLSTCKKCATCQVGSWETTACSITTNRVCTWCTGKPELSSYISVGAACKWVCDGGYHGDTCTPCPADYWCSSGLANRCPDNSKSPAGSFDKSACACQPGFFPMGTMLATDFGNYEGYAPCMKCQAGSICPGSNVISQLVQDTPVEGVVQQIVLAERSLPPAANLVGLYDSIPSSLQQIRAAAPVGRDVSKIKTSRMCRNSVCVECDTSDKCIPHVTVSVNRSKSLGKYSFNVTTLKINTMYTFRVDTLKLCVPKINIDLDFVSGLRMVIPDNSGLLSVPIVCPGDSSVDSQLSVSTSSGTSVRRLLESARRRLLQMDSSVNVLGLSFVVPTNDTAAVTESFAAVGMTVQGYVAVAPTYQNMTTTPPLSCPDNATSPEGSISIFQCVCKPGYQGFASAGTPCSPCPPGKFCSGGLIDLCAANAIAPPMSDAADDCACMPGFYGHRLACKQCPAKHFCSGGVLNATKCPSNAVSPVQSTSSDACSCVAGYEGNGGSQCTLCPLGSWCWGGIANTCPADSVSAVGAKSDLDCLCKDGYRLYLTTDGRRLVTRNCVWCSENTYCKVRQTRESLFNMHPSPPLTNDLDATIFIFFSVPCHFPLSSHPSLGTKCSPSALSSWSFH
jgi:hypothetical protein